MHAQCCQRSEEDMRSPAAGVFISHATRVLILCGSNKCSEKLLPPNSYLCIHLFVTSVSMKIR